MKKLLFLGVAGLLMPTLAQAATVSYLTGTPVPSTLTDWSASLSFPQFNSSLGTLTSVELQLSSSLTTTLTITNASSDPSSGSADTELQVTIQDAGNHLNAPEIDLITSDYGYSLGAAEQITSGLITKSGSSDVTYTAATILSEFTGGGGILLPASTFTQTLLANTGGNTAAEQVTDASATGTVIYTYTPNPEPASAGLLAAGLLGLVGLCRRRRA
jgi:hypothetical protein